MTPIFPTAYLPSIAYMATLMHYENVIIEQYETFPKQTIRNRAIIITAQGKMPLVVPAIRTNGNHTTTKDIEISYAENWNIQHWRSIETAYNSSPYFLYYKDGIEKIIMAPHRTLLELNTELTQHILKKLKIQCEITLSKDFTKPTSTEEDFRAKFSIKKPCELYSYPIYDQVFGDKLPFYPDTSIIDLIFNLGPDAKHYLEQTTPA